MTTPFIHEITNQELQLTDLQDMNGGSIGLSFLLGCRNDNEESSSQSTTPTSANGSEATNTLSSLNLLNIMEKAAVGDKYHPTINPNGER